MAVLPSRHCSTDAQYLKHQIVFYAFDLLHLNGKTLVAEPLRKRRSLLPDVINDSGVLLSAELPGRLADIVSTVQSMGLEGVIAKRKDSPYVQDDRSPHWLKLKLERQQEFVVGGYRPGGSTGLDAVVVGYYDESELHFAAKVRAGFIPHARRELLAKLKPLQTSQCPFVDLPSTGGSRWGGGITADEMKVRGTCSCRVQRNFLPCIRSFCRLRRQTAFRTDNEK